MINALQKLSINALRVAKSVSLSLVVQNQQNDDCDKENDRNSNQRKRRILPAVNIITKYYIGIENTFLSSRILLNF